MHSEAIHRMSVDGDTECSDICRPASCQSRRTKTMRISSLSQMVGGRGYNRKLLSFEQLESRHMLAVGPILFDSFQGITDMNGVPPDPIAAAGPNSIVAAVNDDLAIFNKDGTQIALADFNDSSGNNQGFFEAVDHDTGFTVTDPCVLYDRYSNRYVVMVLEYELGNSGDEAYYLIGVSTSSNPDDLDVAPGDSDDDWHVFSTPATYDFGSGATYGDYPNIAADADSLYITANYVPFPSTSGNGVVLTRLDKIPMLSGSMGTRVDVATSATQTLQPVQSIGRSASEPQLFVDRAPPSGNTWGGLRVWEMDDANNLTVASGTLGTGFQSIFRSPQAGTANEIQTNGSQLMNAVWRNNSLWTVHSVDSDPDPAVDGAAVVRWYEIDTTGGVYSLTQSGDINPGGGIHTMQPAIAVDAMGNMVVTYTQTGPSQFPAMMIAGRSAGDAAGTTAPGLVVRQSPVAYTTTDRWGDYAGIAVDPADDSTFWAFNMFAANSNTWNTWWAAATFEPTVVNTNDDGVGSLRDAITRANSRPGLDTVKFNIKGSGVQTIQPLSPLPDITDRVIVDGYTQPDSSPNSLFVGNDANILIELDGSLAGATGSADEDGLRLLADNSTVQGLIINRFDDQGIEIVGNNNVLMGNFIGTDPTGATAVGNGRGGIRVAGSNNFIGGGDAAERNLVSGHDASLATYGIWLAGTNNRVQGNYIGTNRAGDSALGNTTGVDITGQNNVVGGVPAVFDPVPGNLISGNTGSGLNIRGSGTTGNRVIGNLIGTDATGTTSPLGNGGSGVEVSNSASGNTIGGSAPGEGNRLAANSNGVWIGSANQNLVQGNFIGDTVDPQFGNGRGVIILAGAENNRIGGRATGEGNFIFNNVGAGVGIGTSPSDDSVGNAVIGNAIQNNGGLGIDLASDGASANDVGDADLGPNRLQNLPLLAAATSANGIVVEGSLNSTANAAFDVDFYSSPSMDPSGLGEGEEYLGSRRVNTDASGNVDFSAHFSVSVPFGHFITATATNSNSNTSEFSNAVSAIPLPGDYNRDGVVNTADYDLWRSTFGVTGLPGEGADGNANGVIDAGDYVVWRKNEGRSIKLAMNIDFGSSSNTGGGPGGTQDGYVAFEHTGTSMETQSFANALGTDGTVEVTVDGNTHWRDYTAATGIFADPSALLSDSVLRNSAGTMLLQLDDLVDGTYEITTYHHTTQFGPSERPPATPFSVILFGQPFSLVIASDVVMSDNNSPALKTVTFQFTVANGSSAVILFERGESNGEEDHMALNGFDLVRLEGAAASTTAAAAGVGEMQGSSYLAGVMAVRSDRANATDGQSLNEKTVSTIFGNEWRTPLYMDKPISLYERRRDRDISSLDSVFERLEHQRSSRNAHARLAALNMLNRVTWRSQHIELKKVALVSKQERESRAAPASSEYLDDLFADWRHHGLGLRPEDDLA